MWGWSAKARSKSRPARTLVSTSFSALRNLRSGVSRARLSSACRSCRLLRTMAANCLVKSIRSDLTPAPIISRSSVAKDADQLGIGCAPFLHELQTMRNHRHHAGLARDTPQHVDFHVLRNDQFAHVPIDLEHLEDRLTA